MPNKPQDSELPQSHEQQPTALPDRRNRRTPWLLPVGIGAALLLSAVTLLVVLIGAKEPYATLFDCQDLMPDHILSDIPGATSAQLSGDYLDTTDIPFPNEPLKTEHLQGTLSCQAQNQPGTELMTVRVDMYDADTDDINASLLQERDRMRQLWSSGALAADIPELTDERWRPLPQGEGGLVTYLQDDMPHSDARALTSLGFVVDNIQVSAQLHVYDDRDPEELLDYMEDLSRHLHARVPEQG